MSRTIKLGCGGWGFRDRPYLTHLELAAGLGFRTVEFAIGGGNPGQMSEAPTVDEIREFRATAEKAGVVTPYACIENDFTLTDASEHRAMISKVLLQMDAAMACGATHVRLFAGFRHFDKMDESGWRQLLGALAKCQVAAQRLGLKIAIETHGALEFRDGVAFHTHTVSTHPEGLSHLAREMPAEIGFNYDPGNLKAVNPQDVTYGLELVRGRVNYCHLKDWRAVGKGWIACAPGDDDLDYGSLLPEIGFDGPYLIEYEPLEDTLDGIRRSLAYLKRCGYELILD